MADGDKQRRLEFAQRVVALSDQQLGNMAFSDEAYFVLDGEVNTQKVRRYAPKGERPENFFRTTNKYPKKVMVFLGLHSSGKTFSLKFFQNETINGDGYHSLLVYHCLPALRRLNPESPGTLEGMIWTQDGARVHRTVKNNDYLDRQFGPRQFSLGSKLAPEWPARSPDLNPCDYWLWAHLKEKVFFLKPNTIEELIQNIKREVENLPEELIRKICASLKPRCMKIIENEGGYIEQLMNSGSGYRYY